MKPEPAASAEAETSEPAQVKPDATASADVESEPAQVKLELATSTESKPSESVDSKPVSIAAPSTNTASGIAPVAQFVPSDAKLDQPVVSPEEPLASGEASLDTDTLMDDAPSQEPTSSLADSALPSKSATEVVDGLGAAASADNTNSVPTPPEEKPVLTNGQQQEPGAPVADEKAALPEQAVATAPAADITTPQVVEPVDQPMMDTPSSGIVRPRDEMEADDEPAAKRAKTDEPSTLAPTEAKESVETAAPIKEEAAPATNGNAVHDAGLPAPAPATTATTVTSTTSAPAPARSYSKEPMKPAQKASLVDKMKNTKKVKAAQLFLRPVDPVALNIPHYTNIIKHPMDLSTMEKKLKADEYACLDDFVADFELIINNCVTFNGAQHAVSVQGQNLRAYFLKQMETVPTGVSASATAAKPIKKVSPKPPPARRESRVQTTPGAARSPVETNTTYALLPSGTPMIRRDSSAGRPKRTVIPPQKDLPYNREKPKRKENTAALKFCEHILEEFKKPKNIKLTSAFLLPVDPVALNIPTYFKIVKNPMDLQTMTNKIKTSQYGTANEFRDDFHLMIENCFAFNPAGNPVHDQGKALRAAFDQEWSKKDAWIKKNVPSHRASPASDAESDGEESDADEEDVEVDSNEATIAMLREQLVNMQNTIASIAGMGGVKPSKSKKKKTTTTAAKNLKKSGAPSAKTTIKKAPKKQRVVTYEEKQEISNATENMNDDQINKLTSIITDSHPKYKVCLNDHIRTGAMLILDRKWTLKMLNLRLMTCPMMFNTSCFASFVRSSRKRPSVMMEMPSTTTTNLNVPPPSLARRSISP